MLWPAFAVYAVYTWWQLVHDQAARVPGRPLRRTTLWADSPDDRWTGRRRGRGCAGRRPCGPPAGLGAERRPRKNVAIAAAAPIDAEHGGRGERFAAQTTEEAARLAEYNRYLAELAAEDAAEAPS